MLFPERARAARSRRVARSRPREPRQRRGLADEVDDRGRVAVEPLLDGARVGDDGGHGVELDGRRAQHELGEGVEQAVRDDRRRRDGLCANRPPVRDVPAKLGNARARSRRSRFG
jgi:hypothetical protein